MSPERPRGSDLQVKVRKSRRGRREMQERARE